MSLVGVIVVTYDNPQYVIPCVQSILSPFTTEDMLHVYVVNNGRPEYMDVFKGHPKITVLNQEKNLGWEGGLKKGIEASKEEFLVFMNDDTFIPIPSIRWINHLISHFEDPKVGAAGPSSNVVMGHQSIFMQSPSDKFDVNFLINFCCMVRRKALEEAGGIDDTLPGGDDLDQSIRLRKAGYKLICDKNAFVYHHGFKTGERVNGGPNVDGGWNSIKKIEMTNWALIQKHGLREFLFTMNQVPDYKSSYNSWLEDSEGDTCKSFVIGDKVLEIGCGMRKTVPHAVGLDRVPRGTRVPGVSDSIISVADIVANAEGPFPINDGEYDTVIARHVLEHVVNDVQAIKEWGRVLKHGGKLIIAVPNHDLRNTIPMNFEHVRAWTPKSLQDFMESQGWKTVDLLDPKNYVSFVGVFSKNGLH